MSADILPFVSRRDAQLRDEEIDFAISIAVEACIDELKATLARLSSGHDPHERQAMMHFAATMADHIRDGADALADVVAERAPDLAGKKAFAELIVFWREWTYAWRHADQLRWA